MYPKLAQKDKLYYFIFPLMTVQKGDQLLESQNLVSRFCATPRFPPTHSLITSRALKRLKLSSESSAKRQRRFFATSKSSSLEQKATWESATQMDIS